MEVNREEYRGGAAGMTIVFVCSSHMGLQLIPFFDLLETEDRVSGYNVQFVRNFLELVQIWSAGIPGGNAQLFLVSSSPSEFCLAVVAFVAVVVLVVVVIVR